MDQWWPFGTLVLECFTSCLFNCKSENANGFTECTVLSLTEDSRDAQESLLVEDAGAPSGGTVTTAGNLSSARSAPGDADHIKCTLSSSSFSSRTHLRFLGNCRRDFKATRPKLEFTLATAISILARKLSPFSTGADENFGLCTFLRRWKNS